MNETWPQQLHAWHDFYVIVGTSAAGLTGLMFVVASLSTQAIVARRADGVRAFVTPTVLFFATVLVVAAIMTIPLISATILVIVLALGSVGAVSYLFVIRGHKVWRQSKLDGRDWLWYVGLPILSYVLILAAAVCIWLRTTVGLEILGGTTILLIVIGIRNAWDLVLWMQRHRGTE
jgi:hypothetical protein